MNRVPRGDRALATGYIAFFALIIIGALLYTMFDPAVSQVIETSSQQATTSTAADAIDTREQIWDNILLYPLFLGALLLITRAVLESRAP